MMPNEFGVKDKTLYRRAYDLTCGWLTLFLSDSGNAMLDRAGRLRRLVVLAATDFGVPLDASWDAIRRGVADAYDGNPPQFPQ
jgi:hypothetical protein